MKLVFVVVRALFVDKRYMNALFKLKFLFSHPSLSISVHCEILDCVLVLIGSDIAVSH